MHSYCTVRVPSNMWFEIIGHITSSSEENNPESISHLVHRVLEAWAVDRCPSYEVYRGAYIGRDNYIEYKFNNKKDAFLFWDRWVNQDSKKEISYFVFDEVENKADAIDWLHANARGKFLFFSPFHGIDLLISIQDETIDREFATQFKLTYVGQ